MNRRNYRGGKQSDLQKAASITNWRKLQLLGAITALEKLIYETSPLDDQIRLQGLLAELKYRLTIYNQHQFNLIRDRILSQGTERLKKKEP